MDDLIEQWEDSARRADALAARVEAHLKAGRPVPDGLAEQLAVAEEDALLKQLGIQRATRF